MRGYACGPWATVARRSDGRRSRSENECALTGQGFGLRLRVHATAVRRSVGWAARRSHVFGYAARSVRDGTVTGDAAVRLQGTTHGYRHTTTHAASRPPRNCYSARAAAAAAEKPPVPPPPVIPPVAG